MVSHRTSHVQKQVGCLPEVGDSIEKLPKFDWDSCTTIGCMNRTKEALFEQKVALKKVYIYVLKHF